MFTYNMSLSSTTPPTGCCMPLLHTTTSKSASNATNIVQQGKTFFMSALVKKLMVRWERFTATIMTAVSRVERKQPSQNKFPPTGRNKLKPWILFYDAHLIWHFLNLVSVVTNSRSSCTEQPWVCPCCMRCLRYWVREVCACVAWERRLNKAVESCWASCDIWWCFSQ